jgi:hypothetical protein
VDAREIVARSGPWFWRVPLEGILRVYPSRDPRWGPAGSLDRLQIDYRSNGRPGLLSVSPEDKFAFLSDLAEVCPWLCIDGDRADLAPAGPTAAAGR